MTTETKTVHPVASVQAQALAGNVALSYKDTSAYSRPVLHNVLITPTAVVSCNGSMLLQVAAENTDVPETGILIPAALAAGIAAETKGAAIEQAVIDRREPGRLTIKTFGKKGREQTIRTTDRTYPNFAAVIPRPHPAGSIEVSFDAKMMRSLLNAMLKVGLPESNLVTLTVAGHDKPMRIDANGATGAMVAVLMPMFKKS